MANPSILAAFERMWQHVQAALGNKIEKNTYNDGYIATGTSDGESVYIGDNYISLNGSSGEGASFMLESYNENGNPEIHFYGTIGDEPVAIGGIATPVNEQDAANKEYVDSKFRTARGSWDMSGGTITCGFKPDVVFITETDSSGDFTNGAAVWETSRPWMDTWEGENYEVLSATDTGFVVSDPYGANGSFTIVDHTYYYLAVKFG